MASTSVTVITPTLLGAVVTASASVATGESCTIVASTAQGALDVANLFVRIAASGGSVTPTLVAGTRYSMVGLGNKALTAIASSTTAVIGGQDFEDARFLNTAGTIVFNIVGTGTAVFEAYQRPRATE
jgi:hypothetical protein